MKEVSHTTFCFPPMAQQESNILDSGPIPQGLICSGLLTVGTEWDVLQNRQICHFMLCFCE